MLFLTLGTDMARPSRTGGKKSEAKARNASPAKGRKTTKTKRRIAPAATLAKRRSVSSPSEDLKEARQQQAATAEILKVIASSPGDVQPVFDAIAHSAKRLIGGFSTAVHRVIDDIDHLVAFTPTNPESDEVLKAAFPRHRSEMPPIISLVENGETAQIVDSETADGQIRKLARARGWRSATYTPLMNQGTFIGFIVCTRRERGMLADHHVQLLRTFADQAVIAIENVRLFNEVQTRTHDLTESLEQQTATADVLKVISSSAFDLQKVLDTLTDSAARLCEADIVIIHRSFGDNFQRVASFGLPEEERRTVLEIDHKPGRGSLGARVLLEKAPVLIDDAESDPEYTFHSFQRRAGIRSMLGVPLMRENVAIGLLLVSRKKVRPFTRRHAELATTFADQAVIAIENVRLFDEVQAKTRDLSEALKYQTGSSNILGVIASSPTDVEPVLRAIVESACELCEAYDAVVLLKVGDNLRISAHHGSIPIPIGLQNWPINRNWVTGRAVVDKAPMHVHICSPLKAINSRKHARRSNNRVIARF
jgi:two-component system NtrC family sensor kinase